MRVDPVTTRIPPDGERRFSQEARLSSFFMRYPPPEFLSPYLAKRVSPTIMAMVKPDISSTPLSATYSGYSGKK